MLTSRPRLEVAAAGPCDSALSVAYRKYRARTAERRTMGRGGIIPNSPTREWPAFIVAKSLEFLHKQRRFSPAGSCPPTSVCRLSENGRYDEK